MLQSKVWRAVISSRTGELLTRVVLFYFSMWDGAGAVERGLGRDAAIQSHTWFHQLVNNIKIDNEI